MVAILARRIVVPPKAARRSSNRRAKERTLVSKILGFSLMSLTLCRCLGLLSLNRLEHPFKDVRMSGSQTISAGGALGG